MIITRTVLTALSALALAACATTEQMYDGPERARSEAALLIGMSPPDPVAAANVPVAQIKSVDGRRVSGSGTRVEVLPGAHELVVNCKRPGANPTSDTYLLTVEAGMEYVVTVDPATGKCRFSEGKARKAD